MAENDKEPESRKPKGKEEEEHQLLTKLEEIRQALVIKTSDDMADLLKLSRSTRRILVTNFLLGLSRGVGFFIGVSFLGALVLALLYSVGGNLADKVGASEQWQSFTKSMSGLTEMIEKEKADKAQEKEKDGETGKTNDTNDSKPDRKQPPPE